MSDTIVWVHGDCLSPENAALQRHPEAPALFVWDDALLQNSGVSLKRIVFMYECLLELPVEIARGDVVTAVAHFARECGAQRVATMATPAPGFVRICQRLEAAGFAVTVMTEAPFVELTEDVDLRRFSRYWRQAQPALRQGGT